MTNNMRQVTCLPGFEDFAAFLEGAPLLLDCEGDAKLSVWYKELGVSADPAIKVLHVMTADGQHETEPVNAKPAILLLQVPAQGLFEAAWLAETAGDDPPE